MPPQANSSDMHRNMLQTFRKETPRNLVREHTPLWYSPLLLHAPVRAHDEAQRCCLRQDFHNLAQKSQLGFVHSRQSFPIHHDARWSEAALRIVQAQTTDVNRFGGTYNIHTSYERQHRANDQQNHKNSRHDAKRVA